MDIKYHYGTVSQAISQLRKKGFSVDFNLKENCLVCNSDKFKEEDFEITDVFYYEGESDPGDEATVYGIKSKSGIKGILVTGDEIDTDPMSNAIIQKLLVHRNKKPKK